MAANSRRELLSLSRIKMILLAWSFLATGRVILREDQELGKAATSGIDLRKWMPRKRMLRMSPGDDSLGLLRLIAATISTLRNTMMERL